MMRFLRYILAIVLLNILLPVAYAQQKETEGSEQERDKIISDAKMKAAPLFNSFTAYIKKTKSNVSMYLTEEDRKSGQNPLAVFAPRMKKETNKPEEIDSKCGYALFSDGTIFGEKVFIDSSSGADVDYKTAVVKLGDIARCLIEEKRIDDANAMIDRFVKGYKDTVKDIESLYQTEFQSLKVYEAAANTRKGLVQHIEGMANQAYADKKFDQAILLSNDAQELNSKEKEQLEGFKSICKTEPVDMRKIDDIIWESGRKAQKLDAFEKQCRKQIDAEKIRKDTDFPAFDPERPVRHEEIDASLKQAEILISNEEYVRARDALEKVLVRDPYNQKATRMLQLLYDRLFDVASARRYNEELEIIAENRWNWNEAVLPTPAVRPTASATAAVEKSDLSEKLTSIIIDQIDFEDASISSVISHLIQRSKELDTSASKTGVSIMLRLTADQVQSTPRVTMNLDNVPMGEVIRYICQSCGLKYRIEERAVIISSDITDVMDTRFFKVRAALVQNIVPNAPKEEEGDFGTGEGLIDLEGGLTGGGEGETAEPRGSLTSQMLKDYFTQRGVPFTDAATAIAYDRRGGKLVVKNSPENLRRLEYLLRELDIETPLVLIETKFVELTETDLTDIGFEWLLSKTPNKKGTSWTQITQNASTTRPFGTNASGIPSPVEPGVNDRLINNLQIPGFGPSKEFNLDFFMHALDRSTKVEVLSAPKVIATSGQPAVIRMVREEYYPSSWTEPEVTIGNNVIQITPSYPELGDATDLGIRLEVTATVSPNNYTIALQLHPQVRERLGWTDYSYDISISTLPAPIRATLIMPELSLRDVTTNVKVYDGETLILGGMIRDDIAGVDDRVPFAGDVPLIGRLFRTKNERSTKRNLVIFVTSRLVNPDGIPVRMGETRGMPDFRR